MGYVVMFLGGSALLGFVAWARAGRSGAARWWPGSVYNESAILGVLPGFGLMCVIGTVAALIGDPEELHPAWAFLWLPVFFACVGAMGLGIWGILLLRFPERMFPTWAWPKSQSRKDKIDGVKRRKRRSDRRAERRAVRAGPKAEQP